MQKKGNNIFPFTEEAIGLISEKSEFNASSILERAYGLIESAVNENINLIDVDFVNAKFGKKDDFDSEFSNDVSKEDSDDLFSKAKK